MTTAPTTKARGSNAANKKSDSRLVGHKVQGWGIPVLPMLTLAPGQPFDLPNNPARALAKVASKLIFNMSVTPVRETITIGKWRASLWPPDAPLDQLSASLRCARSHVPLDTYCRDRDPLYLVSFP